MTDETRWLQDEQRHLLTQTTLINIQGTLRRQLAEKGAQRVQKVKERLLADAATPESYRLILFEFSVPNLPSVPTPSSATPSQKNISE